MGARVRRARGDRGAVLVEAVFVFPIVFFIVLGIFEYGLLFAAQSTAVSATREGARFGSANFAVVADKKIAADQIRDTVVNDLSVLTGYDLPIQLLIYRANDQGLPFKGTLQACTESCFHYTWNGTTFAYDGNTGIQWTTPLACTNATIDNVGVYVEVQHNYVTGAFGSSQLLKEHTVTRLEPLPLVQCP